LILTLAVFRLARGHKRKQFIASQKGEKAMKNSGFSGLSIPVARLAQW
jgi:hypothetical protein